MVMTKDDLKAIREREAAASEGPWVAENNPADVTIRLDARLNSGSLRVAAHCGSEYGLIPQGILFAPDADFVANARQDVPALCDEVERLMESRQRLAETNLMVRRTLERVGFAPAVAEIGGCMKTGVVEQVERLATWAKQMQDVRDALVKELRGLGYSDEQMRSLIGEAS
jgi:hypothetical protein